MKRLRTLFFGTLVVSSVGVFAENKKAATPTSETPTVSTDETSAEEKDGIISRVGSGFVALAYLPVNVIDFVGDKAFVGSAIGKLSALNCLNDNRVGNWLTNHNKELTRVVVVAVIGGAAYYCWQKNQESKEEQNGASRGVEDFDFNLDDSKLFEVKSDGDDDDLCEAQSSDDDATEF